MVQKRPTQNALAAALGISPGRVTHCKARGMPVYSVEAARAWRLQNVAPVAPPMSAATTAAQGERGNDVAEGDPPPDDTYWVSRARREKAEASMAEMKERELTGDLIRARAVRAALAAKLSSMRDALLQLSARLAPVLAAETDLAKVRQMLDDEIYQALLNLSTYQPGPA